jgi:proteic killer suppression protein
MPIRQVRLSNSAKRALRKVPGYIADKLETWVDAVERDGLAEVRKIPGYHDEPLKGDRHGQRSIRLSRDYRAIYTVNYDGIVEFVSVEEVSKHEY